MRLQTLALTSAALLVLAACSQSTAETTETTEKAAKAVAAAVDADYKEAPSGDYLIDKGHAYIVFTYSHHGYSKPLLRWRDWDSTLTWDNEAPENSSVTVDIKTAKVDTGVDVFDEHLQADRWFDAATYPDISFKSTSLTKLSGTKGTMVGDLTLKGITKPVTLDVTFNKAGFNGRSNSHKLGFSATGALNRSDWNLGGGVPAISDNVDLTIEVEYEMEKAEE